ncbi:MAG: choice-of-anchor B family protein, partial [Longimicrobiales bacterium]
GRLGSSVLMDRGRAMVGAPRGASGAGSVLVFENTEGEWEQTGELMPRDGVRGSGFGLALEAGRDEIWVGAPNGGGGDGLVHRFTAGDGDGWSSAGSLSPDSANTGAWPFGFGSSITAADDVVVVGMPRRDFGEGRAAMLNRTIDGEWDEVALVSGQIATAVTAIEEGADCEDGTVELFECNNMEVVSFTPVSELGGSRGVWVNDVWGWSDPVTGRDFALVSRRDGAAFVDLSDPAAPRLIGSLPRTAGTRPTVWRDIKVYQDHAYIVSDGAGAHGMQVFDLTRLRSVADAPVTFTEDAHYDEIYSAHNVVADTASGFLYVVGANGGGQTCGGGLHMVDVREPKSPAFAGCYNDPTGPGARGYTHDAQCVIYQGPDTRYTGRQVCVGANEVEINIADVTDKDQPVPIGRSGYPNSAYAHQGWLDESHRYFYMGDEGDEVSGLVDGTRTLVWDIAELDDPILVREYIGPVEATDHNLYIRGDRAYMSNYGSGLRVLDITDPENPHEVAYFDSAPLGNNEAGMSSSSSGAWSNYPFFESGLVVFTSVREGLFVVRVKPRSLIP